MFDEMGRHAHTEMKLLFMDLVLCVCGLVFSSRSALMSP